MKVGCPRKESALPKTPPGKASIIASEHPEPGVSATELL